MRLHIEEKHVTLMVWGAATISGAMSILAAAVFVLLVL